MQDNNKGTLKMTNAEIYYKDTGDYLSRKEKLKIVKEEKSILNPDFKMSKLKPNKHRRHNGHGGNLP